MDLFRRRNTCSAGCSVTSVATFRCDLAHPEWYSDSLGIRQFWRGLADEVAGFCRTREVNVMPREAKLFLASAGSAARGFLRFRANIPPRWIKNASKSRKRIEPEIVDALRSLKIIQRNRPRARVALKNASKQLKAVLSCWETAYNKENFYRGIRILLELQRQGSSKL
jgi:hypothetical protein